MAEENKILKEYGVANKANQGSASLWIPSSPGFCVTIGSQNCRDSQDAVRPTILIIEQPNDIGGNEKVGPHAILALLFRYYLRFILHGGLRCRSSMAWSRKLKLEGLSWRFPRENTTYGTDQVVVLQLLPRIAPTLFSSLQGS
jgi:hypothetical protein